MMRIETGNSEQKGLAGNCICRELMRMASISLKGIHKCYPGNVIAVSDFNLEIADKEFVVLVGPSGCGKTTTLRMIAGLEEITNGDLYIGDRRVNDIPAKDRDIAMVFQSYAMYPHMTVYENMAYALKLRKVPKEEINARIHGAARVLEIENLLERRPKALSGGQRQRVALGRAMVRNPSAFLLDEPLSNLDAKLRASMRTEIKKLHERLGTTFVYVTHDQTEAMTLGDRIVVMKDGYIKQIDTPKKLYNHPHNVFTAGFIGSPQMNFFDGVLEKDDSGYGLVFGAERISIQRDADRIQRDADCIPGIKAADFLEAYVGKKVRVGIRPEDIHDDRDYCTAHPYSTISAEVELLELLGSEVLLYLNVQGYRITARVPPDTDSAAGACIMAGIDTRKLHLFDTETENAIHETGCDEDEA
jgi:multiple sugar transport system ATP-binding protein